MCDVAAEQVSNGLILHLKFHSNSERELFWRLKDFYTYLDAYVIFMNKGFYVIETYVPDVKNMNDLADVNGMDFSEGR